MNIGPLAVADGHPCRIVAEMSNAHNGDLARAVQIIRGAHAAGADAIKFQCYTPDELVALRGDGPAPDPWGAQGWSMRDLYAKAQTPHAWFSTLAAECARLDVPWFSSVFGPASLALLESLGCPAYKVARLDNQSARLIADVRATTKPLIVSGAQYGDVWDQREESASSWNVSVRHDPALLLYCPEGYPQSVPFTGMRARFDRSRCDRSVAGCACAGAEFDGFSYHGRDGRACVIAATLGATMIEAHVQLDDAPSELEADVSLTMTQFARMVQDVRATEALLA